MPKKLGGRSGNTARKLEAAFTLHRRQAKGHESCAKCVEKMGGTISREGFRKGYLKWLKSQPPMLGDCHFLPGSRSYIDNLKTVSAKVVEERQTNGRSTEQVIRDESSDPGLTSSTVNKHIRRGRAGQSPLKRGRKSILPPQAEKELVNYFAEASVDLEPMSHAEARGAVQNFVEGTPHQQLFKKGCVSKGFLQGFVKRHHVSNGGQLWSEFPQNMTHL